MALDNQNTLSNPGSITKEPTKSSGKWRNLIIMGASIGSLLASGYIGFGIGIRNEQLSEVGGSANRIQSNIVAPLMVHENTPGAFANGGSGDVITGITKDGSLLIQSGALLMGPDGAFKIALSGSNLIVKGTMTGFTLSVNDTSGSGNINVFGPDGGGMCFFDVDAAGWTVCSALNGSWLCSIATAGYCPRS